jgi:hypothetical protein
MNPFIELLERPVATLTLAGYALAMLALTLGGLSYVLREGTKLYVLAEREHRRGSGPYEEWWGDWADGWIPPAAWVVRAWKTALVAILCVWALATVVYMVG